MDVAGAWAQHLNPAFVRLLGVFGYGRVWSRAEDIWVWDAEGRRYIDALAGFGAVATGHNHPRIVEKVRRFFDSSPLNLSHTGPSAPAALLATELARRYAPLTVSLLANGGAEAVDAAIKLAVAATGRTGLVACDGGFHGTSIGALALMGHDRLRAPFVGVLAAATRVPWAELGPVRDALATRRYAAFFVEPVQAEGGVRTAPAGWLEEVAMLCHTYGTLLVFDEIQCGLGRCDQSLVIPDVRLLGKALGAGLLPVSVALTTPELQARAFGTMDRFDLHSSTYGGGALGCAVATEALAILDTLTPEVHRKSERLRARLAPLATHPFVRAIRVDGLLVGIELGASTGIVSRLAPGVVDQLSRQVFGQWLALRLLEAGVVAQPAALAWNVLRLEPPLTIDDVALDLLGDTVVDAVGAYTSIPTLLADVSLRLGDQAWRKGAFR